MRFIRVKQPRKVPGWEDRTSLARGPSQVSPPLGLLFMGALCRVEHSYISGPKFL